MVRLKVTYILKSNANNLFQFHYGTIKRKNQKKMTISKNLFQFHYGTIKSDLSYIWRSSMTVFQFHYGTIKSDMLMFSMKVYLNFNSIMVRLKVKEIFERYPIRKVISIPLWYD